LKKGLHKERYFLVAAFTYREEQEDVFLLPQPVSVSPEGDPVRRLTRVRRN
jgi:hypothetical protein